MGKNLKHQVVYHWLRTNNCSLVLCLVSFSDLYLVKPTKHYILLKMKILLFVDTRYWCEKQLQKKQYLYLDVDTKCAEMQVDVRSAESLSHLEERFPSQAV